jgi:hypothetical protein
MNWAGRLKGEKLKTEKLNDGIWGGRRNEAWRGAKKKPLRKETRDLIFFGLGWSISGCRDPSQSAFCVIKQFGERQSITR